MLYTKKKGLIEPENDYPYRLILEKRNTELMSKKVESLEEKLEEILRLMGKK